MRLPRLLPCAALAAVTLSAGALAAEELCVTPSAVSHRVKQLEHAQHRVTLVAALPPRDLERPRRAR